MTMGATSATSAAGRRVPQRGRPDPPSLVAGVAIVALGALVLAHQEGVLELRFATLAPAVCAALGTIMLALRLSPGR